ncbi:MAG: ABC transporter ATP-binding protein [Deltaproteobacteria bacterium]|nr:ABC transporter ATP-binding protein [Deltaproteobacteria bacterium]
MPALLEAKKISKFFQKEGRQLHILTDVNLELNLGEELVLWGASGSGKTTLLHLLGGLEKPSEGEVFFEGQNLSLMCDKERAQFRNRNLGFVFQSHHLLPLFTALENVRIPLQIAGKSNDEATEQAKDILQKVGLEQRFNHYPDELSGGEQQRVAIARALIHHPKLILADEPTGNLDSENSKIVFDLLLKMNEEQHSALIVVTHNPLLAERMGRRLTIQDGHVYSK